MPSPRSTVHRALLAPSLSLVSLVSLVSLASCGGKGGGARFVQPGAIPIDLLTRRPEAQRPVVVKDGTAYLFLRFSNPMAEDDQALALPSCWTDGEQHDACAKTAPVADDVVRALGPVASNLTVLGVLGPCLAKVGAPVLIDTSGCEPSAMVAAPLTGCPVEVAPIGRVDRGFDPDLRWRPAPALDAVGGRTVPLFDGLGPVTDPVQRRAVTGWLAEPELNAGTRHEGRTVDVQVDAGAEALESVHAGFLIGDGESECDWSVGHREVVGLRRGEVLTPLDVPAEWDGALTWRGRVVGVASGLPRDITVHAVGPDGKTAVVFEANVWWDNEECTQGGWAQVEYPCGP